MQTIATEVCAVIVKILLPKCIQVPREEWLRDFKMNLDFQFAGVVDGTHILIMFPMECPADYLIERVCTLLCMEWWTIWVDLLRCTSGGLEDCTMQGCFPTRSCLRLRDSVPPTHKLLRMPHTSQCT